MQDRITTLFNPEQMLPAIGQGSLGIELRIADTELLDGMQFLHDPVTATAVTAERAFLLRLEGGCQVPIGGHATVAGDTVTLVGLIADIDGKVILREQLSGPADTAEQTGIALADTLLAAGGREILAEVYANEVK
jgi:hydroxymethylbilane synthase